MRHPQGDLLIDTGLGRSIAEQMREFPLLFRQGTDLVRLQAAADQLDAVTLLQLAMRKTILHSWKRVAVLLRSATQSPLSRKWSTLWSQDGLAKTLSN